MATEQQPTLKEYYQRLDQEWTRTVACQNQCQPPEECSCLREIIHVEALSAWWKRKLSEHDTYFIGKYRCIRVFSLLLKKRLGHLIDRFYQSQMSDMAFHHDGNYDQLRENLSDVLPSNEVEPIIHEFRREKWSFCPLELELHMDRPLADTKVIAPFCHKIKLNEGGTASVYLVAVQEDLIRDEKLRAVLQDSLYEDSTYGNCYKMAMKTYVGNKKSAFEAEKDAFSALKSDTDVPIVRYLGSFTHDYGEGITSDDYHLQKTYNLLLEYGELDLYQYWADETNVPPVRVNEIICYWEKLFEIAVAIRKVHHLDVSQGKNAPLRYYGWHADIKPDNILLVNGRFKLADFGFSGFTPVAKTKSGTVPTDYIHGFTDSYGAPEVTRMMRPNGTTSEVTQSIDTWSFGCVLSVAATWVVLGFQGVRQYETLRRLSPKNINTNDRFHDGINVLPEVKKWHNYLRGHLRHSDTATSLVLDLIEYKMLRTETNDRIGMKALCKQLQKLIKDAKEDVANLESHTRTTDNIVLKALLNLEKEAQALSSLPKKTPLRRRSKGIDDSVMPISSEQESAKDAAVRSTPLGQTTFRKEILEHELHGSGFVQGHEGGFTDSPVDAYPPDLPQPGDQKTSTNLEPMTGNQNHRQFQDVQLSPSPALQGRKLPRGPFDGNHSFNSFQTRPSGQKHVPSNVSHAPPRDSAPASHDTGSSAVPLSQINTVSRTPFKPPVVHQPVRRSGRKTPNWSPEGFQEPPSSNIPNTTHEEDLSTDLASLHTPLSIKLQAGSPGSFVPPPQIPSSPANSVPHVRLPASMSTHPQPRASHSDANIDSYMSPKGPISPTITVTSEYGSSASRLAATADSSSSHDTGKQVVTPKEDGRLHYDELPHNIHDLPYPICWVRKEIDEVKPKGVRSHLKTIFTGEERQANAKLKKTYGKDREIVLIVDNGWTMFQHWPIVTFVAETLVKHAAGLDKDGIDLMFTVDGGTLNIPKIKGESGRQSLQTALRKSWPEDTRSDDTIVDMAQVLADIYKSWQNKGKKPTTLLVLTDGDWSKTDLLALHQIILDFARLEPHRAGPRHFSIQLIRFGEEHKDKLTWLDDSLCQQNQCKDIVDHCSWRTTVDKMFKGSIETYQDSQAPSEPDITYYYPHLVKFFDSFNDEGAPLLSPDGQNQSRLSLSRTPSRSSIQRKHASAPAERMSSEPRSHRKTYSVQSTDMENKEYK